jgi:hypothetical protein
MAEPRTKVPMDVRVLVLTEAGYRCAVPTCRTILALDLHHILEVSEDGGNEPSNLIALCPTCHALYTRGEIKRESIGIWKAMLVTLGQAFDKEAVDSLLFLDVMQGKITPMISGETVFRHSRLIAAGLVNFSAVAQVGDNWQLGPAAGYRIYLTPKGKMLVDAWKTGDRAALKSAIGEVK